jgi:hypothetical protein
MKNLFVIASISLFSMIFTSNVAHSGPLPGPDKGRYPYCNVYMNSLCFGIAPGERLSMDIGSDFVIYKVSLIKGASVDIYDGYNADSDDIKNDRSSIDCSIGKFKCLSRNIGKDASEIFFNNENSGNEVFIKINGKNINNGDVINDFVHGFRGCERKAQSVMCADTKVFSSIGRM